MNKKYFFSIIVTVYNKEKYIEQCLDSIIPYLNTNYELIIVNDGSTDNSLLLCQKKVESINNCSIINRFNRGVSAARNAGIKASKGRYLIFVDGDDWIFGDVFKNLEVEIIKKLPDFVLMNTLKFIEKNNEYIIEKMFFSSADKLVENNLYDLINNKVFSRPWRFIVSRDLIKSKKLLFHEGLIFEDEEWSIKLILSSQTMLYFNEKYYVYRKTNDTITSNKTFEKYLDLLKIVVSSYTWCAKQKLTAVQKKYYRESLFRCIRNTYGNYQNFSIEQKKYILEWNKENKKIISDILRCDFKFYLLAKIINPIFLMGLTKKIKKNNYIRTEEKTKKI